LVEIQFIFGERTKESKLNHYFYEISRCEEGNFNSFMKAILNNCSEKFQSDEFNTFKNFADSHHCSIEGNSQNPTFTENILPQQP
jgi:hypothetical protein